MLLHLLPLMPDVRAVNDDQLCVVDSEWGCVDICVNEHMGWMSQLGNNCPQNLLYISNKNN